MKQRITALLLVVCLLAALTPTLAVTASDVKGHWAQSYIETLQELGIMEGYPDGTFRPDNNVTKAELVTLLNRTFGLNEKKSIAYSDVTVDKWYYDQFRLSTGYVFTYSGGTKVFPDTALTRQEAGAMFSRLMGFTDTTGTTTFTDDKSISSWAKTYIYAGAAKNLITGYPQGDFRPAANITRAEVATVLVRLIGNVISRSGTYTTLDSSYDNVTVMASGVTLRNMHIKGDLYITAAVGSGLVTLENCKVDGEIIAVGDPGCTLILAGSTAAAEVRGDGMTIAVTGTVEDLTVTSADQESAAVNITTGASVTKLTMKTPGTVSGSVQDAYLYVSGVSFTVSPDSWTLNSNTTVTIAGTIYKTSGTAGPAFADGYPKATIKMSSGNTRQTVSVTVQLAVPAQVYCIAVTRGSAAPTAEQVRARANYGSVIVADSNMAVISTAATQKTLEMSNLPTGQSYDIYVVAETVEISPKLGSVVKLQADTTIYEDGYPEVVSLGTTSVTVSFKTTRTASLYMTAVLHGAAAPTAAQMKNGDYGLSLGRVSTAGGIEQKLTLTGLTAGATAYDLYVAAADGAGEPKTSEIVKFELASVSNAVTLSFSGLPTTSGTYSTDTVVTVKFAETMYKKGTVQAMGSAGALPSDLVTLTAVDSETKTALSVSGYTMQNVGNSFILVPPATGWTAGATYTLHFDGLTDAKGQIPSPSEYSFAITRDDTALRAPTVSPSSGSVQPGSIITISMSSANAAAGAYIIYTIDGNDPRTSLTTVTYPAGQNVTITIPSTTSYGTQIRVRAYTVLKGVYSQPADVTFNVQDALLSLYVTNISTGALLASGAEVAPGTSIQIMSADPYAQIYYTTDGTDPSISGTPTLRPQFTISQLTGVATIKAIAVRSGSTSAVQTFTYTVTASPRQPAIATPIVLLNTSALSGAQTQLEDNAIYSVTSGQTIYIYSFNDYRTTQLFYTTDGTDPALASGTRQTFTPNMAGSTLVLDTSALTIGAMTKLRVVAYNTSTGKYSSERALTIYRIQ